MADVKELNINNTTYDIKAKTVVNQNGGSIKYWTGTQAQYDAIATKDANTLYNITDDTDVTLTLLNLLYPVGAIYIGTMSTCPLAVLGVGTWQLKATDRVLQGAGTRGSVGTTVNESLPNITGEFRVYSNNADPNIENASGAFGFNVKASQSAKYFNAAPATSTFQPMYIDFDTSRSSSTYQNNAPVQQDAYLVNIWERIN